MRSFIYFRLWLILERALTPILCAAFTLSDLGTVLFSMNTYRQGQSPKATEVTCDRAIQGVPSGHRLGFLTRNLIVPLSAQFCLGRWEFGRSGLAAEQNGGTLKSKSTKPWVYDQMGHPVSLRLYETRMIFTSRHYKRCDFSRMGCFFEQGWGRYFGKYLR